MHKCLLFLPCKCFSINLFYSDLHASISAHFPCLKYIPQRDYHRAECSWVLRFICGIVSNKKASHAVMWKCLVVFFPFMYSLGITVSCVNFTSLLYQNDLTCKEYLTIIIRKVWPLKSIIQITNLVLKFCREKESII